jgi:hypothetical protein
MTWLSPRDFASLREPFGWFTVVTRLLKVKSCVLFFLLPFSFSRSAPRAT